MNDRQIRFSVAEYDHTQPLTIDPVLNYSTYIGGEVFDLGLGIALDAAGDAYIAGGTASTTFPQMNPVSGTPPADVSRRDCVRLGTEPNRHGTSLFDVSGRKRKRKLRRSSERDRSGHGEPCEYLRDWLYRFIGFPGQYGTAPFQGNPVPASVACQRSAAFITKLAPSAAGSAQLALLQLPGRGHLR